MSECTCPLAGWCERYGRALNARQYAICNGTSGLPPEREEEHRQAWAAAAGKEPGVVKAVGPRKLLRADCVHRGGPIRSEPCQLCGAAGKFVPIHSCSVHGECVVADYKKTGAPPAICIRCPERLEPTAERPAMPTITPIEDHLKVWDRRMVETHALRDVWKGCAGFLVCGGPSLKEIQAERLKDRGIVSLAINNSAGFVQTRAMTFTDPPKKFHHGVMLDPAVMKLVPQSKMGNAVRAKLPSGEFKYTDMQVRDCPNVWAYQKIGTYSPETFLTSDGASMGNADEGVEKTGRPKIIFTFFVGLRLMHYLGVRRVYLLGADFNMDPARGSQGNYAFGQNRSPGECNGNNSHYRIAATMLKELRPYLEAAGMQVFNCNPKSNLTAFDFVKFEDAYTDCRGVIPPEPFDLVGWYEPDENDKARDAKRKARKERRERRAARQQRREERARRRGNEPPDNQPG